MAEQLQPLSARFVAGGGDLRSLGRQWTTSNRADAEHSANRRSKSANAPGTLRRLFNTARAEAREIRPRQ